jgi:hypothetical protein
MSLAIANRRKQLAQCIWLRRRIDGHLADGDRLIVAGDLNDGPGLDDYERLFGRSGVEIVLGGPGDVRLHDPHAAIALQSRIAAQPTTARFFIATTSAGYRHCSTTSWSAPVATSGPALAHLASVRRSRMLGDPELRDALLDASDHFPVTLDLAEPD